MAPAIKPIAVTIPSEKATPGSNIFLIPSIPDSPALIADEPPAAAQCQSLKILYYFEQ